MTITPTTSKTISNIPAGNPPSPFYRLPLHPFLEVAIPGTTVARECGHESLHLLGMKVHTTRLRLGWLSIDVKWDGNIEDCPFDIYPLALQALQSSTKYIVSLEVDVSYGREYSNLMAHTYKKVLIHYVCRRDKVLEYLDTHPYYLPGCVSPAKRSEDLSSYNYLSPLSVLSTRRETPIIF